MTLFVDTSAWYAAADAGDRNNARARRILQTDPSLLTSDHVLVESWSLLRHRLHRDAAERFWGRLRAGVSIEPVGQADLETAWGIGAAYPDQDFSIVDRTSFALMQRLGVHTAASFDSDFAVFRFGPRRERAFNVLR
ncbi:MAG TPA: PIN domain-containing protein [Acidimicrobiales bacterium]|nr:PIN domain-containing protein [Acidimicrobiales bacterium]